MINKIIVSLLFYALLSSCSFTPKKLPYLGDPIIIKNITYYPTIHNFKFTDQDNRTVTNESLKNKIYVANFIFLNCPSICPKMVNEMHKVYNEYKDNSNVCFISHTIDPQNDSIARLNQYAKHLGINSSKWFFVTGHKDSIYSIAQNSYYAVAYKDDNAPGGYTHSASMLLIDTKKHIRGVYNGIDPKETSRLINDIETLLLETN
jgi:protein SCO1/2